MIATGRLGAAGLGEQLPQQRVHAVGVALERRAPAGAARDVGAQLVARRVERRAERGACARLRS